MTRFPLLLAVVLAGCASPRSDGPPPPRLADLPPPATRLVPSPAVCPPANDIPEAKRIAWFEAHKPPPASVPALEREEIVVHEHEPACDPTWHETWCGWSYAPIGIGLSFAGGHWRRHHGWGWSFGWHRGWDWCW
jgi:hypothetical protein